MKQSVLEYKKLLEQKGLLVEFAEPEGKEGEDRPVTLVTYFSGGADQGTLFLCKGAAFKEAYLCWVRRFTIIRQSRCMSRR